MITEPHLMLQQPCGLWDSDPSNVVISDRETDDMIWNEFSIGLLKIVIARERIVAPAWTQFTCSVEVLALYQTRCFSTATDI